MHNWRKLVDKFVKLVRKKKASVKSQQPLSHPVAQLVNVISINRSDNNFLACQENILLTSLTVACLKSIPFRDGTIPDLPGSVPAMELPTRFVTSCLLPVSLLTQQSPIY